MTEKLSPRLMAAMAELKAAAEAEAPTGMQANVLIMLSVRPGETHVAYSGCTCAKCAIATVQNLSRVLADWDNPLTELKAAAAVDAAGQVH